MLVGTSPELVDTATEYPDLGVSGQVVVMQNLGPGDIYVDFKDDVSVTSGVKIAASGAYEFPRGASQGLYVVASANETDVRIMAVG